MYKNYMENNGLKFGHDWIDDLTTGDAILPVLVRSAEGEFVVGLICNVIYVNEDNGIVIAVPEDTESCIVLYPNGAEGCLKQLDTDMLEEEEFSDVKNFVSETGYTIITLEGNAI